MAVFTHDAPVSHARFSTDGRRILTYSVQDGSARVWSVGHASPLAFHLPHDDRVSHLDIVRAPVATGGASVATSSNAFLIASGSVDGLVRVWRYDSTTPWVAPSEVWKLVGHQDRVRRVAFSPSGRQLASAAIDGSTRVWDMVTGGGCALTSAEPARGAKPQVGATDAPAVEFYRAVFSPTERWLLTASNDPTQPVRLWAPAACRELPLPPVLEQDAKRVQAVAVATAPNGAQNGTQNSAQNGFQLAATGNDAGTLTVAAQAADGSWSQVCRLQRQQGAITDIAFAPDGRTLATVGENGQGALVPITSGASGLGCGEPSALSVGTDTLYSVRFAPDGAALVTTSQNGRAQFWDTLGRQIADLKGHRDRLYSAEFSPDGRWIATASRDGGVRLWRRPPPERAGGRVGTDAPPILDSFLLMEEDLGPARVARFTPDGNGIAVAYRQNEVVLWRTWSEDQTSVPELAAHWGEERARLALIREAARFRRDNRLDAPFAEESKGE
jgi:WD40 repeat protein